MNTLFKLFFIVISLSLSITVLADCNDFVPGQVLIKFKQNQKTSNKASLKTQMKANTLKTFPKLNVELWDFSGSNKKLDVKAIVEQFKNHPDIEYIEPNYIYHIPDVVIDNSEISTPNYKRSAEGPNDPEFSNQWYLHNTAADIDINALEAWAVTDESPSVKVAILDSGIEWTHEDLVNNIWQNSGEDIHKDGILIYDSITKNWMIDSLDINGIDDDNNGYIDDIIGWDFIDNDNNPMDNLGHGTQVAGIIGAVGNNNIGIAGISWKLELAALKIFGTEDGASCSQIIEAVNYSVEMGFPISNNSWGDGNCDNGSETLYDAIAAAQDNEQLFIASAGNNGSDNDEFLYYPASYDFNNIIAVAAIGNNELLLSDSNFGDTQVDIAAPGQTIRTTFINDGYNNFFQTSSAAPQVSAACALIKYLNPNFSATQIKNTVLSSATVVQELFGKVATNGRLNLDAALKYSNNPTSLCRITDSLVLRTLYGKMDGPNWINGWNLVLPMDNWNGVTLNNDGCVVALDLSSRNLTGSLPVEIGTFFKIQSLKLNGNQISGKIPEELGNLTTLKVLHLNNNNLTEMIPPELYLLENLEDLDLSSNNLNGAIQPEIDDLINLISLKLNGNDLTGTIPVELGELNDLNVLLLNNNKLAGNLPAELSNLANSLTNLQLQVNQLSGCYEADLLALCAVNTIIISQGNNFDAPWEDFCLDELSGLCGACQMPDEAALIALYNATDGANWPNASRRWNLNEPVANWEGVTLDDNGCVIELNLGGFQTGGTIPSAIGNLSKLRILKLWGNNLTGTIPVSIGNLINLNELVLSSNNLMDAIPSSIGDLINLKELWLNSNSLSGVIPGEISNLRNLTDMVLDNNITLTGIIPNELGSLENLELLSLSNNDFLGNIPAELGNLTELQSLLLFSNSFSGPIPKELGNLCNLEFLALNSNQLSGIIPPELGDLKKLLSLLLDNNNLIGTIPFELCNLFEVFAIDLSNNQLTGVFPPCFGDLQNMTTLVISDNDLSGCYDNDLRPLCSRLVSQVLTGNRDISDGNNFTVPWEDFCSNDLGICDLVWPGDFNEDGRVTENDALFWGLAHGNTGSPRQNATMEWIGQDAIDWNSFVKGVNGKHQDANGDGEVKGDDLQVVKYNFGRTRTSDMQFVPNSSNTIVSERIPNRPTPEYNLFLKAPNGGNVQTHGIALSIDFGDFKVDMVKVDTIGSCIAPQEVFEYLDTEKNIFHLALTKIDKQNEQCGPLTPFGRVIVISNNIPTGGDFRMDVDGSSIKSDETIEGMQSISVQDNYPIPGPNNSFSIGLNVNHTNCDMSGTTLGSISANTISDSSQYDYIWNTGATTPEITDLTPGFYQVIVTDLITSLVDTASAEIQGQFIPQYDEDGNLIPCDYGCPTLLTFNNSIQNGTHQARTVIRAEAQIDLLDNVTFKASDRIILGIGFTAPANATFNATIEDCE